MVNTNQAKDLIEAHIQTTEVVEVPLIESLGGYLATHIFAPIAMPSFSNSAMDGYGFRYMDSLSTDTFTVVGKVPAGKTVDIALGKGEAVRIFTGERMPSSVDTVVIQEKVTREGNTIHFDTTKVKKGENIRFKGEQSKEGDLVLHENTFVNAAVIGFLASLGIDSVKIFSKPTIGLLYTGDELVEIGNPLPEGKIYNANSYTLQATLAEIGQSLSLVQHIADTQQATEQAIREALEKVDILLLSGGISVGDYDFVRSSLQNIGVEEVFYKVAQKPGKPLYFGKYGHKRIFALPGNPASVFTCYHMYVKPFILGCYGRNNFRKEMDYATLTHPYDRKKGEVTQYLKAYVDKAKVMVLHSQESHKLDTLPLTNCLLEFPAGKTTLEKDEKVKIWRL